MTLLDPTTRLRPLDQVGGGLRALLARTVHPVALVTCAPTEVADALAEARRLSAETVLVAVSPGPNGAADGCDAAVLATADRHDPLVYRTAVDGEGQGRLSGLALRFFDVRPVHVDGAEVLATAQGHPVVVMLRDGERRIALLGGVSILDDRSMPVASNAVLVDHLLRGGLDRTAAALVRGIRARNAPGAHPQPLVVEAGTDVAGLLAMVPDPDVPVGSETFLRAAARAARALPTAVHDALVDFADRGHPSGALVVRGLPVGDVPATPPSPRAATGKDGVSEFVLLTAGRRLGQPIGYEPEHSGAVVQNLVPTKDAAGAQTSTSSAVMLEFHTEAAFHPHKPRFLLLLGLRADPFGEARTLLCSVDAVLGQLSLGARAVLTQPRFRTSVDESYTAGRSGRLGRVVPVLSGDPDRPTLTFDADLMTGVDAEAAAALEELRRLVHTNHIGVALGAGDLLVVDNHTAVHGRSPFRARYDGTDRWLQRSFVVADLDASAGDRAGRVITTRFTP